MKIVINKYEYLLKLDINGLLSFIERHAELRGKYAETSQFDKEAEQDAIVHLARTLLNEKISHYVKLTGVEI